MSTVSSLDKLAPAAAPQEAESHGSARIAKLQRPNAQTASTSSQRKRPARGPFGFSPGQWNFLRVLFANWIVAIIFFFGARAVWHWEPAAWNTLEDRLRLVMTCSFFAIMPAIFAIMIVAAQRLNTRMMVGHMPRPNSPLEINTRFILNTFEQFTMFFVAHVTVALYAPVDEARSTVLMTVLFLVGRMTFWIGYHRNPLIRAFGFGLTFYPIVATYFWLFCLIVFGVDII